MTTESTELDSHARIISELSLNRKRILLENMRKNKSSNWLIIIGIVGLAVALIVGLLIWRAILK